MSPRKIIFFIVTAISLIVIIATILLLQRGSTQVTPIPKAIKIWITDGTSEGYDSIIQGFKEYAPEYKDMEIVFEKKTTDPIRYRTLLLSTMTESTGPDIFMVGAGEDIILESKIEPIPESALDFSSFEKRYDDIFLPLIVSTGSKNSVSRYLMGVPLGFETLGLFYNKSLIREVPRTWDDMDIAYDRGIDTDIFVSNLGLGPRYTDNAGDIIGLFYRMAGTTDARNLKTGREDGVLRYLTYRDSPLPQDNTEDTNNAPMTLSSKRDAMDTAKSTTLDLFMRGEIAMIIGYPSLVMALEKSDKRAGLESVSSVILTEKIPLENPTEPRKNLVKYNYFAISKTTPNPTAALKFIEYLLTTDAEKRFLQNNAHLVAAQREFWSAQQGTKISTILSRASMDAFIPDTDEELSVFSYGLKAEFENFLSEYIDRNQNIDINNISEQLSHDVGCSIDTYSGKDIRTDCEKN